MPLGMKLLLCIVGYRLVAAISTLVLGDALLVDEAYSALRVLLQPAVPTATQRPFGLVLIAATAMRTSPKGRWVAVGTAGWSSTRSAEYASSTSSASPRTSVEIAATSR